MPFDLIASFFKKCGWASDELHVSDCDFEGAKTLKLSAKTADFGRLLQFFGKKTTKMHKILAGVVFFNDMNFTNSPDIGRKHKTQAQI